MCIYHLHVIKYYLLIMRIAANRHVSLYLPIWLVCVMVQTASKCALWRTECAGCYLEAGSGSVLARLSDRYPGKAHLNPRCSGQNSLCRSGGDAYNRARPLCDDVGDYVILSEEIRALVHQNKARGTSYALPSSERAV